MGTKAVIWLDRFLLPCIIFTGGKLFFEGNAMKHAVFALFAAGVILIASGALAEDEKYELLDKHGVYYGDCSSFENPATIAKVEIFAHIRTYKLIQERKLDENDPEYWILLVQANETFRTAVTLVAASSKYDLVAERGAIKAIADNATVSDITHLVVAEVKSNTEDR